MTLSRPHLADSRADPPGGRRREESEQRRQRILEAAQDCLGELGYSGATVTEIARRAGVSNGLLYQFFRNKEALFEQVLEAVVREWVRQMVPRDGESASQALEGMFRRSVGFCRAHPLLPALLRDDPALQLSRLQAAGRDRIEPHRELVARLLARGVESGEFRPDLDPAATADVICQLQSDYSGRACREDERFPDDPRIIDAAVDLIRAAVGPHHASGSDGAAVGPPHASGSDGAAVGPHLASGSDGAAVGPPHASGSDGAPGPTRR